MKHLTTISIDPISIQYDQTSNRLKDLLNEIHLKFSRIDKLNPAIYDDQSFEQNRSQLISHLNDTEKKTEKIIHDREQIQLSVQKLDQNVLGINQNIKGLRNNLENYRLADNNIDELQVNKKKNTYQKTFSRLG